MNINKLIPILPLFLTILFSSSAYAENIGPDALVKNTADEVLVIINKDITNGDMNKIGALVEEKIASKFDFDLMSKLVLGRNWNTASKEQQGQFITEFRSLLIRTYSSALSKYQDQTIEYKPQRAGLADTRVKVRTEIIQPGGPTIPLNYSLKKIEGIWKVYDVSIDGLSMVAIYRGQFSDIVKRDGMDGLIQKLSKKNG